MLSLFSSLSSSSECERRKAASGANSGRWTGCASFSASILVSIAELPSQGKLPPHPLCDIEQHQSHLGRCAIRMVRHPRSRSSHHGPHLARRLCGLREVRSTRAYHALGGRQQPDCSRLLGRHILERNNKHIHYMYVDFSRIPCSTKINHHRSFQISCRCSSRRCFSPRRCSRPSTPSLPGC